MLLQLHVESSHIIEGTDVGIMWSNMVKQTGEPGEKPYYKGTWGKAIL